MPDKPSLEHQTYDICNPKRLPKVAKICEDFGLRRQYSVLFCRLAAVDLVRLKSWLYDVINLERDQVLFLPSVRGMPRRSRRWDDRSSRMMW